MSNRTHFVKSGDTYELLSSRYYGDQSGAGQIQSANPGAANPPQPGTAVVIPDREQRPAVAPAEDGIDLRIGGVSFRFFTRIAIVRRLDAMDTIEVEAPQADTPEFRDLIKPLSFPDLSVFVDREQIFNGTVTHMQPELTAKDGSKVRLSGYSTPGILADCMLPPGDNAQRQFRKMNLPDIATKVIEPFSIQLERSGEMGSTFRRVRLKPGRRVLEFLTGLAKQRKVLIGSTTTGALALRAPPAVASAVVELVQGELPLENVQPTFAPQSYYSHITGIRRTNRGGVGSKHTVLNPLAQESGIVRPLVMEIRDVKRGELNAAAEALAGRMLASAVSYDVRVGTWKDPQGVLWEPGSTVSLHAPGAFVYEPYDFQVRSVRFQRSVDGDSAVLSLMLPGVFDGQAPDMLPWS